MTRTLAGFAEYMLSNGLITFTHTEIDPAFEGKGLGSQLVRFALDDVRASGKKARAVCSYVASYVTKHPEYADVVEVAAER